MSRMQEATSPSSAAAAVASSSSQLPQKRPINRRVKSTSFSKSASNNQAPPLSPRSPTAANHSSSQSNRPASSSSSAIVTPLSRQSSSPRNATASTATGSSRTGTPSHAAAANGRPPSGLSLQVSGSRPTSSVVSEVSPSKISVSSSSPSSSNDSTPAPSTTNANKTATSSFNYPKPLSTATPTAAATPGAASTKAVTPLLSPLATPGSSSSIESDQLPRTAHAERILAQSLSAAARRSALAKQEELIKRNTTATQKAIALAGSAALRMQAHHAKKSSNVPTAKLSWNSTVADSRTRSLLSVPINRLMNFTQFLGLFGEMGKTPEGVLALFGAALWLYAQAIPPLKTEHATSELQSDLREVQMVTLAPDASMENGVRIGGNVIGSHAISEETSSLSIRRRNQSPLNASATGNHRNHALQQKRSGVVGVNARGAIIGTHFEAPLQQRGTIIPIPGLLSPSPTANKNMFGVNSMGLRAGFGAMGFQFSPSVGSMSTQPQDLAAVADSIILFLLDDLLTEIRDNSPKRYFRATDRALLDHYLRGHPDVIVRYAGADRKQLKEQAKKVKEEQRLLKEKKKARKLEKKQKALRKAQQQQSSQVEEEEEEEEEEDDNTYQVSLKNSSDEDTSSDEDKSSHDESKSNSDEDEKGDDAKYNSDDNDAEADDDDDEEWTDNSTTDAIQFSIEENAFSLDTTSLHLNPNTGANAGESRVTTRFFSSDHFNTNLTPVRLRKDRAGIWRIYNFYAIFFNSGLPMPSPIEIPTSMPVVNVAPSPSSLAVNENHNPAGSVVASTPLAEGETAASVAALDANGQPVDASGDAPALVKRPSIFAFMASGAQSPAHGPISKATTHILPAPIN